jgi:hypothetical protein
MMPVPPCAAQRQIDAHFEGRLAPERARDLRGHVASCTACHDYFARRQLLADLDPTALSERERIGFAIGLARRPRPTVAMLAVAAVVAAAAAGLLLLPGRPSMDAEFAARGAPSPVTNLLVYRVEGERASVAEGTIGAHDELAFSYLNGAGKHWLLVFGVDEHKHVFWYYPSFDDPQANPTAISIEGGPGRHHLREAIGHELDGRELSIRAIFTDEPLSVVEVERRVALDAPFPDAVVTSANFTVTP